MKNEIAIGYMKIGAKNAGLNNIQVDALTIQMALAIDTYSEKEAKQAYEGEE